MSGDAEPQHDDAADHEGALEPSPALRALVDRWLAVRVARGGTRAADGSLVCRSDLSGRPQAWRVPPAAERGEAAEGVVWPQPLTAVDRVESLLAHPDDPETLVARVDVGGDEHSQIHRVRLPGGGTVALTDQPEAVHQPGALTRDGTAVLACATRRDGVSFDLWRVPLDGSEAVLLAELPGANRVADRTDDDEVVILHPTSNMESSVWLLDASGEVRWRWGDDVAARHATAGPLPGGGWLALSDRDGEWLRLGTLSADGAWAPLAQQEEADVDAAQARDGLAAWARNEGGASTLHVAAADALDAPRQVPLPTGVVEDLHVPAGGGEVLFTFSGPRHSPDVWSADPDTATARPLTAAPAGGLDLAGQPEPTEHRLAAHDGEVIPLWLTRPTGVARPPVVTWLHGGPESQARPSFNPLIGLLVEAGYAVAQPNVRGSTGYGRRFAALDDRELRADAIRDVSTVGAWLASRDDLDGDRIAVGGGSYGGYLTLSALVADPDRWAAGIDIVGIADLETFLERTAGYRRALREAEYGSLETDRATLRALSPLHRVEEITAPLLVLHGRNDPRVPVSEAEQITTALRSRGRTVAMTVYEDEGHGFAKDANRRDAWARMVAFLDAHLGAGTRQPRA